jgi:membrane-associated protease RseP (regulator of RpoE activity)
MAIRYEGANPHARTVSVFLAEPERTPYDLNWRMFGVHVRVHPLFWLISVILGGDLLRLGVEHLLVWVACVFVSILVHEFGHVLMGQVFGSRGHIVLYSFGGVAVGSNQLPGRWQRVAVLLAGPGAGFLLYGLVWLVRPFVLQPLDPEEAIPLHYYALFFLEWINLVWGIVNLVPIWPLDGGQISVEVFSWLSPERGLRFAFGISFVLAGLLAVHSLMSHLDRPLIPFVPRFGLYGAFMFGWLAFISFQFLQQQPPQRRRWEDDNRVPWERDADWWRR